MVASQKLGTVDFTDALDFSFPQIKSVKIENVAFAGEWVEGDIVIVYEFGGEHSFQQHFKTKLNEETSFDIGALRARIHVWLEGARLWLGLVLCLGPLCAPEFKTSIDLPT